MQPFPHSNDASYKINIGQLASEIFKFYMNYDRMTEPQNDRTTEFRKYKANPVEPPLFQSGAIIRNLNDQSFVSPPDYSSHII